MEDQAFSRSASEPRHGQGIDDQLSCHALAHRPADHLPAEQVDDDGQVQPAFLSGNVRYIAGPHQIRSFRLKVTVQHVIRNRQTMMAVGGRFVFPLRACPNGVVPHHLAHPLLTNPNVPLPQLAPDPRPPVGASGFGVDRLDVGQQRHVAHSPCALVGHFLPMQVLLKSSDAGIQDRALRRDRPVATMPFDEGVLHRYSLAKYAAAFFNISRSIFTRDNSVRSRLISICSALTAGAAELFNPPLPAALTQLCSVCSDRPRFLATVATRSPPVTRRTASSLNSSV